MVFTVRFRAIIGIWLANLVLLTSTGVLVNLHYCLGNLKSVGIYAEAIKCSGARCNEQNHGNESTRITKHSCCQNSQIAFKQFIEYDGLQTLAFVPKWANEILFSSQFTKTTYANSHLPFWTVLANAPPNFFNSSIKVLFQVFRL